MFTCLSGLNTIYFFPTRTDVIDFSKSRVGPLLYDNPFLAKQLRDTDTVGLKRIGDANLYFRGMKSTVGMKSVPADMIVFDELDEATPEARAMAWERIAHSRLQAGDRAVQPQPARATASTSSSRSPTSGTGP